jgi:hypothetical protein
MPEHIHHDTRAFDAALDRVREEIDRLGRNHALSVAKSHLDQVRMWVYHFIGRT